MGNYSTLPQQRMLLAVYLAHIKLGTGRRLADWAKVRLLSVIVRTILRKHLLNARMPDALMMAAHAASEDLRTRLALGSSWEAAQAQAIRVAPVALHMLSILATSKLCPEPA